MSSLKSQTIRPAVLTVTGEDALAYLQSQFSNNLKRSDANPVTYGLFLDRKGKVQADAFILQRGDEDFLLISYHSDAENLQNKVEENVIADEVEFEDVSAQFKLVTFWDKANFPENILPPDRCFCEADCSLLFNSRRVSTGIDCLMPTDASAPTGSIIAEASSDESILAARIESGIPAIPQDIGSNDLPHEGGDLSVIAVSYTKGCYLGQEVMARLHAMGRPQRALYRVNFASQSNDETIPIFAGKKQIGTITSHIAGVGIALLKHRYVNAATELCITEPDGPTLHITNEITA